jgi:hypothetical protein
LNQCVIALLRAGRSCRLCSSLRLSRVHRENQNSDDPDTE